MPMSWTPANDRKFLVMIIKFMSGTPNYAEIAKNWPDEPKPTPKALSLRYSAIKKEAQESSGGTPSKGQAPGTPKKPSATPTPGKSTSKKGKSSKAMDGDESPSKKRKVKTEPADDEDEMDFQDILKQQILDSEDEEFN